MHDEFKVLLSAFYSVFLLITLVYLAISGYASFWKSSLYIGAGVGCFTIFYATTLLVACHGPTHPITGPPSASYGARACALLLTVGWALSTGFVIAASVRSKWIYSDRQHAWVYAELATIIMTLLSSLLVSVLQHLQHRRHEVLRGRVKVRYCCGAPVTEESGPLEAFPMR
ncbi:hypothetical protein EST38_g10423 [Candolleomyces aberdarensis]|uniref:Uncharacterized protein n=1 Tax=Candolleomyces aberdarensis TaxID=2316362 RepID=A0A4Q2DAB9_9AGAR|nr:hypothetical protein EST38_g10423 [Candolleomyces aberdarensis]